MTHSTTVNPTVAEQAARTLIADADAALAPLRGDRELLALLRQPPEELQIILPALRAAKALLDGAGADAALTALSEFSHVYLRSPIRAADYDGAVALTAAEFAERRLSAPAEVAAVETALRALCGAHLAVLSGLDGQLIDGFQAGAQRRGGPALSAEQLLTRLRDR